MPMITPFGNPDGARSDINEVLNNFVEFDPIRFKGLGLQYNDLSTRVIAGIKGSGKTVYLRRIQDAARSNDSVFADFIQHEPPSTHDIIKFCQVFPEGELDDMWERLWYCAILQSLASYILYHPQLKGLVPGETRDVLLEQNFKFTTPVSIYSQATSILNSTNSQNAYRRFLYDDKWNTIIYHIRFPHCPQFTYLSTR